MTQTLSPPPSISQPIALANGLIAREWYRWLYLLGQQAFIGGGAGNGGSDVPIAVNASPFVYAPTQAGTVLLSGGGITALELSRTGIWREIGSFRAPIPMSVGDSLRVSWTQVAPTMIFFPR